jgi:cytochrome c biogenesis protein CcmG/thiol:disulfide interchange protein DsbE
VRWLGVAAAVLPIILILGAFGSRLVARGPGSSGMGVNAVGQAIPIAPRPVPAVALAPIEGGELVLAETRGKVVVLNFWSSWCVPCQEEAPALERAWQRVRERDVLVVGVNMWEPLSDARRFVRDYRITFPNAPDPNGRLAIELGLTGIPETYIVDARGQIVRRWVGPIGEDRLLAMVAEVEAESRVATMANGAGETLPR